MLNLCVNRVYSNLETKEKAINFYLEIFKQAL
ncbi:hypothetical protein QE422_001717 [Chryseobacterium sp. SORGH_AS 447]|nr:hypothetical protein [Chryseobacterium sp. SORGH_AS_0447]